MLQNASCMFLKNKTKQKKTNNYKKKKIYLVGVELKTFDVLGQCVIHCAMQPLSVLFVK